MKLIESIEQLLEEIQKENKDYFVQVSSLVKSDKVITLHSNKEIHVYSAITKHKEVIPLEEIDESILSYYIEDRSLYSYN